MSTASTALAFASAALLGTACARLSYALARIAPTPRPALGPRGLQRGIALQTYPGFALLEPTMRWLAALVAHVPLGAARAHLDQRLVEAGDALGLDADECLALSCLGGVAGAIAAQVGVHALAVDGRWTPVLAASFAALPLERVRSTAALRKRRIARELPAAIDLVALCMGAGLDFAGAIAMLVARPSDARSPLAAEFRRLLSELSLGRTRSDALGALAARAPTDALRDFTSAVIQAEQKGNPLQDAIAIQARTLRMRRSALAEEAAARAAVLLAFPLLLLLASLLLLMLGPFIVNGVDF